MQDQKKLAKTIAQIAVLKKKSDDMERAANKLEVGPEYHKMMKTSLKYWSAMKDLEDRRDVFIKHGKWI
jgi:hypothetical protein